MQNPNQSHEMQLDFDNIQEIWQTLVSNFKRMSFSSPRSQDIKASLGTMTSSNDHISLALKTDCWIESIALLDKLRMEEIEIIKEISSINMDHIVRHQKFTYAMLVFAVSSFMFVYNQIATEFLFIVFVPVVAACAAILCVIWSGHWKAFELDTCIALVHKRRLAELKLRAA